MEASARSTDKALRLQLVAVFAAVAAAAVSIITYRNREKRRQLALFMMTPDTKHVDIGAIFGLDVGGTLSKLVYFEPTRRSKRIDHATTKRRTFFFFDNPRKKKTFKRSQSLENLNTPRDDEAIEEEEDDESHDQDEAGPPEHTMALESFYEFINAEGSPIKAEVRDENLTFYSRVLGGELHFMKFETRMIDRVVDIVKSNRLHQSINSIGCTGGGAYKFSNLFSERLGIILRKMDELDCLMRGLEFVLQHVVGECYTFKCEPSRYDHLDLRSMPPAVAEKIRAEGKGGQHPLYRASSSGSTATPRTRTSSADSGLGTGGVGPGANLYPLNVAAAETVDLQYEDYPNTPGIPQTPEASPRSRPSRATSSPDGSPRSSSDPPQPPLSSRSQQKENREWKYKVQRSGENVIYPFIVCNIGSGVSILKVESPGKYERVSGSSIGGGTYWGLCRLLTRAKTFDEVLDLAEMGEADVVDMTVGDIYGRSYDKFHLASTVTASSFGKLVMKQNPGDGVKEEDMARALLLMVTSNIGQVAYLNACMYKATHIYFVGNFLRHNKISCRRLAFAIDYWSGGKMEALFLEHEGYFGALGAFLNSSILEESGPSQPAIGKLRKNQTYTQGMPYPADTTNGNPINNTPLSGSGSTPSGRRGSTNGKGEGQQQQGGGPPNVLRKEHTIAGYRIDEDRPLQDDRPSSGRNVHQPRHFNFPDVVVDPQQTPPPPSVSFQMSA